MGEKSKPGVGILSGTKVIVGDNELRSFLKEKGFGEEKGKRHEISLIEAIYLVEKEKMQVTDGKKILDFDDLLKNGNKVEENFYAKYSVYSDLRGRGLLVRTGLKFGSDFRVYERGSSIKSAHSKYLVHVIPEEYTCSFPEIARGVRLSKNVNKAMIYAIVDEEGDITYYQIDRVKL
ncbi:MAG TPA: tRNA-intron lyase [Candidatus Altiarchaeales archaeon]|nr:tRNA-intron lyase [Candidatus Altiarchaeales archaeon]